MQGLRDTGACLSPFNAFLFLQGVETLHLRMQRHCENALAVAQLPEAAPARRLGQLPRPGDSPYYALAQKYMPDGAGALLDVRHQGRPRGRQDVHQRGQAVQPAGEHRRRQVAGDPPGLDDAPAADDEEQQATGVTPEMVRLSVGIEDIRDIIADLDQALAASQEAPETASAR